MLSAIIVNLSWVLPIIYIWSLPLLRQTDLLTTTDEDQNSISHYIGDATGTGMLASVSFPAFFLLWIFALQDQRLLTSICVAIASLGYAAFLCTPSDRNTELHLVFVSTFVVAFAVLFASMIRGRTPLLILYIIALLAFVVMGVSRIIHHLVDPLRKYSIWFCECLALSVVFLFTPAFYSFGSISM